MSNYAIEDLKPQHFAQVVPLFGLAPIDVYPLEYGILTQKLLQSASITVEDKVLLMDKVQIARSLRRVDTASFTSKPYAALGSTIPIKMTTVFVIIPIPWLEWIRSEEFSRAYVDEVERLISMLPDAYWTVYTFGDNPPADNALVSICNSYPCARVKEVEGVYEGVA